jgi:hypothetical protein
MTKHKRPNNRTYQYAVTHLVVTDRVADRLRRLARAEGRKIQWLADRAIGEWLDGHEKQEGGR